MSQAGQFVLQQMIKALNHSETYTEHMDIDIDMITRFSIIYNHTYNNTAFLHSVLLEVFPVSMAPVRSRMLLWGEKKTQYKYYNMATVLSPSHALHESTGR